MKKLALVVFATGFLIFLPFLFPGLTRNTTHDPEKNLPWQIDATNEGNSRVFGLVLGSAKLEDALAVLGPDIELAIVAAPGESGQVEGFYATVQLGFVQAKAIFTVDLSKEVVSDLWQRAPKAEFTESGSRKIHIARSDKDLVLRAPIASIAIIPTVNLDEVVIAERFGVPEQKITVDQQRVHWLYPAKGLDILIDRERKELLQYVPPRNFELLRQPLLKQVEAVSDRK